VNRFSIHPLMLQGIFAVAAGAVSGILFATGFGAIALSIFIALLICGLLVLSSEYFNLKHKSEKDREELEEELSNLNESVMGLAEIMQQKLIGISEGFGQDLESVQESHHEDIQDVYRVISTIMGEGD
jgi:ABC-type transport system involved in cytochrome bd biosynthesis fused ATPase/permease subunit